MNVIELNNAVEDRSSTCCDDVRRETQQRQCRSPVPMKINTPYKIALTGNSGVGKSSLAYRLADPAWRFQKVRTTIGVDCRQRTLEVNDRLVKVQLVDTQGVERYGRVTSSFFRAAHAVLLVFDVTDYETFQDLWHWHDESMTYQRSEDVVRILVGNKSDLLSAGVRREVEVETAKAFADEFGMTYVEASACDGSNLDHMLLDICRQLVGPVNSASSPESKSGDQTDSKSKPLTWSTKGGFQLDPKSWQAETEKEGTCLTC